MKKWFVFLGFACLLIAPLTNTFAQQDPPKREITKIAGDLYRFQNNFHFSVFLVTPEGVIVTDPINAEAAQWLKDEIAKRFNQPIKYLIYSHFHGDHISGGEVFAEPGVEIIGHERTKANIAANNIPTAAPTKTFSDQMTIELGGKKVELIFPGKSHSDDLIVMYFPAERTVFTVDFISAKRLPWRNLPGGSFPDWFTAIDNVVAMDFDILAPGHGVLGGKQDAIDHGNYLRELHEQVKTGKDSGKSMEELQASITMDAYKDWGQYDAWLKQNIEGMYSHVSN